MKPTLIQTLPLRISRRCVCLAAFASLPFSLWAQATAPASDTKSDATAKPVASTKAAAREEVLELSPFVVNTERDDGFRPSSALTGGRMAQDLKDSAMAYSALTREFIDTMGITDLTSATEWTTNSYKILDPAGGGDTFNITVLGVQRSTGSSGNRMVNFFPYYAPLDSYNVDRLDFGRGPNAVMFGNGTLGGTQVALTKRAIFGRSFQRLDTKIGSYDYYRVAADFNQPINDKFGARLNLLYQNAGGWRDLAQDDNKAASATITFRPTAKTEIRLEGERGRQERQIPYIPVQDQFAGWNGQTTYNGSNNLGTAAPLPTTGPITTQAGNSQGVQFQGGNSYFFSPSAGLGNTILEYQNNPITQGAGATTTTPYGPYTAAAAGGAAFNTSGGGILFGSLMDLPDFRFNSILASPYTSFVKPSETFVNGAKGPSSVQDYKNVQLTASHAFTSNLQVEVAGTLSKVNSNINNLMSGFPNAWVDINRALPDGSSNPNFGRFYSESQYRHSYTERDNKAFRASVAYLKDFGKWGNYGFNMMLGSTQQRLLGGPNMIYSLKLNPDHRQWQGLDVIRVRKYFGDDLSGDSPTGTFTFKDNNYTQNGTANNVVNASVTPDWVNQITSAQDSFSKYNYGLIGGVGKFFKDKLVVSGAVRRDKFLQRVRQSVRMGDYPMDWDGHSVIWRPDAPADWASLSYQPYNSLGVRGGSVAAVGRPTVSNLSTTATPTTNAATPWFVANPSGVAVRDLRYESDRFQDDYNSPALKSVESNHAFGGIYHITNWAAVGYNSAGSYSLPGSTTPAIDGTILPPVRAKGFDLTSRFTLFKGRLNIIYTYFQNDETGAYISAGAGLGQVTTNGNINGIYAANAIGDLSSTGRNIRNGVDVLGAANDIRDRRSQGNEVEVTGNVTKGWRVQGSVSYNRVEAMNSYPMSIKYIDGHADLFKQIVLDTGATFTTTPIYEGGPNRAAFNPFYYSSLALAQAAGFGAERVSIEQQGAVDSYNNLYLNRSNFQTKPVNFGRTIIVNAYTDYTFQNGFLKKLTVGIGYQYRNKQLAGYRGSDTIVNPANPATAIDDPTVDAYTPIYIPSNDRWTGNLRYTWKMKNGPEFVFGLRIDNLLGQHAPIMADGVTLRPKGGDYSSPARETVLNRVGEYRAPRSYMFSTTVNF